MSKSLSFLRPYLDPRCRSLSIKTSNAHLRFYSTRLKENFSISNPEWRRQLLNGEREPFRDLYPRCPEDNRRSTKSWLLEHFGHLAPDAAASEKRVTIYGRVTAYRSAGKNLTFITVERDRESIQIVCNFSQLQDAPNFDAYQARIRAIAKGDIYKFWGCPYRTSNGELSILLKTFPRRLSTCLHPFVSTISNPETKIRNRHVGYWTSQKPVDILRLRSSITRYIRDSLNESGHLEVQTPILAHEAGGAVARPFHTSATEFPDRQISLRIAPELWLKRLVLGGLDRVFEIGPCFRNEGLDTNHNPEFTTCEFYRAYANLEELITTTERMLLGIDSLCRHLASKPGASLPAPNIESAVPYGRLDFIPTIESCLNKPLPDLSAPSATSDLLAIFKDHDISIPTNPTLPRLLDKLSSKYVEPHCQAPTFIVHHPECLAPLAKSFTHPKTGQQVAASAELFVKGQEIANMYEEENSPFEQRRKFEEALKYREDKALADGATSHSEINESYIEALEWGLPPTGGWGCGIDRLVMLFSGASRIADVLTFGTLKNVVNLGRVAKPANKPGKAIKEAKKSEILEIAEVQKPIYEEDSEDKVEETTAERILKHYGNADLLTKIRSDALERHRVRRGQIASAERNISNIGIQNTMEYKEDIAAVNMLLKDSERTPEDAATVDVLLKTSNRLWKKHEARQRRSMQVENHSQQLKNWRVENARDQEIIKKMDKRLKRPKEAGGVARTMDTPCSKSPT